MEIPDCGGLMSEEEMDRKYGYLQMWENCDEYIFVVLS